MENVKAMKKANIAHLSAMELTDSSVFDGSVFCGGTAVEARCPAEDRCEEGS